MVDQFFEEQAEQSQIKAEIVTKYFLVWSKVIIAAQKRYGRENRVAYIDLFAGPGRYRDGALSTPIMILQTALQEPDLCERLVAIFNDKDEANTESLQQAISELPGIEKLKHKPQVWTGEVGDHIVQTFASKTLIPSFLFVDPFGYKGLSLQLVNAVLKDWGCDCVFFFNYNRISMGLNNDSVIPHMQALFGATRAAALRERFNQTSLRPMEREAFIVDEMTQALREMGGEFVLPFRFRNPEGTRTTHHLFFVSKHFRGYDIMRGIMYDHSHKEQGVAKFEYNPADARWPSLFDLLRPLEDLEEMLLEDCAGETLPMKMLYESHSVGKPFVLKNYREVLCRMEQEGKVTMDRPCPPRKRGTLAPDVQITFPRR
ncbi:three-Cys-motif partner protein TcmP [Symmachiella dynata]|uniref:three-Cys-motif partner protein TcmP n=1 Tax=Symmachiella dynata TaxID=2527995 RepID=UPI0030EE8B25